MKNTTFLRIIMVFRSAAEAPTHTGYAGMRVFEPGECRAIRNGGEHARCVFAMPNVANNRPA